VLVSEVNLIMKKSVLVLDRGVWSQHTLTLNHALDLARAVHLAASVDIIRLKDFLVSERSVRCFDLSSSITIRAFLFMSR
jgi:hypothetical protein